MVCLGEEVEGCDLPGFVTHLGQETGIAAQGGRITRNIGNRAGIQRLNTLQGAAAQPGPRWVGYQNVGTHLQGGERFFDWCLVEFNILNSSRLTTKSSQASGCASIPTSRATRGARKALNNPTPQ